jgi:predicted lipid-binding transport protein (Tim44 family)
MQYTRPNENPMTNNSFNPNHNVTYLNAESPNGFNADAFLREAKVQFIRLQTAYDQKNLADLRQFTSPEVFGEIQLQLQERQDAINQTDVVTLEAKLVDAKNESPMHSDSLVASVEFSGQLRENGEQAEAFNEIWHFKNDNQKWIVAGIQQT